MVSLVFWLLLCQAPVYADDARQAAELESQSAERFRAGDYQVAAQLQSRALRFWEQVAQTRPVNLAAPHANLARIYLALGHPGAALREARQARQLAGPDTTAEDRARIGVLFGQIHFQSHEYAEAARELQAALPHLDGVEGATAHNDLGMVTAALGDLAEARRLLETAAAAREKAGAAAGPDEGRVLANLALVCFRQGDLTAAEAFYAQAIVLLEHLPEAGRAQLGMALAEYSQVLRKTGRKAEAKSAERRAQAILRASRDRSLESVDVRSLR